MKYTLALILYVLIGSSHLFASSEIPPFYFNNSHDVNSLLSWGPYSKRYAGISHIEDIKSGTRFDFSVMPGYYRGTMLVPNVLFESSYFPWKINPAMTRITYRYQLEWKDKVYVDVTYNVMDDFRVLVEAKCVNNTGVFQNLNLNNVGYIDYAETYPEIRAIHSEKLKWINAIGYSSAEPARKDARYNLVYDGWARFEERNSNSVDGSLLAKNFGKNKGDRVVYRIDIPKGKENGSICFRYRVCPSGRASFVAKGLLDTMLVFRGTGEFNTLKVPYSAKNGASHLELTSEGGDSFELDGFFWGDSKSIAKLDFVKAPRRFAPVVKQNENRQDFVVKYPDSKLYYGVSWNYPESGIREILNDELDLFFRKKVHDHVSKRLVGNNKWHYTNAFLRPIILAPNSAKTIYTLVCAGDSAKVDAAICDFHKYPQSTIIQATSQPEKKENTLPEGKKYEFGYQLLQAALLSNVVYPVYTQGEYIRHFTPGKNWNSLYTWDSGFIALGLTDIDPLKAFECIRAYTTEVGAQSAFIHHGTPLPIQFFAYLDLWNQIGSEPMLRFLYPRLKQYFEFMVGINPTSTTRMRKGNLLKSWDYFYNSGGWDDYPPQKAPHGSNTTPAVTAAFYIRAAKILRMAAQECGIKGDVKLFDKQIKLLGEGLQKYAWDQESGYFGYVEHDAAGNVKGIYRYADGSNFNKGLDGTSPLISGICSPKQFEAIKHHLFNPKELWTGIGLSTVDQSAPYYKNDGYWNGAVWMPHQWVLWKSLLDMGEGDLAYRIAKTALGVWEKECRESYHTFEHFIVASGRGAGWHQFSGLSSPILNWFSSYFKIGKVTAGFEIWLSDTAFSPDYAGYQATLKFDGTMQPHERCMLLCLNPDYGYSAVFDGKRLTFKELHPGLLQVTLPATNRTGKLSVIRNAGCSLHNLPSGQMGR